MFGKVVFIQKNLFKSIQNHLKILPLFTEHNAGSHK